jgi:sec-independent protein translocase protein TatC
MARKEVNEMSFLDHLEDLRWHLIRICAAVVICGAVAFFFKGFIFETIIFGPKKMTFPTYKMLCNIATYFDMDTTMCSAELPFKIQARKVATQFSAHIWTSILAGFVVAFPYVIYQLWRFISPGLNVSERKNSRGFIIVSSILFFLGVLFGYYIITPLSINFLGTYSVSAEVSNEFDLDSYIGLVRASVLACGIIFELPIIIYFLTRVGLVTPKFLRKNRKVALVLILILSAIITPPDVASQIIVAIPVVILYEVSIYISKFVVKKETKKDLKHV